jgi:lysophospholipase L1-like esterase
MSGGRRRAGQLLAVLALSAGVFTSAGSAGPPQPRGPTALFFGDSLFGGTGALPRRPVEPRTTADVLGWHPVVDAFGGTGYTTGGQRGRPYLNRLHRDHYLSGHYAVVVVEGGTNDAWFGSLGALRDAAIATLTYVRSRQPQARIVVVGGYAPPGVELTRYRQMDTTLAAVASQLGLQYVSQLWFSQSTDPTALSKDHYHPSDLGYGLLGRSLAQQITTG